MSARSGFPFPFPLEAGSILRQRAMVLAALLTMDEGFCRVPAATISQDALDRMLRLYDQRFLSGMLSKKMPELTVTLSARLTSAAGKFLFERGPFGRIRSPEIRMSSDYLLRLNEGPFSVNGLSVATAQEAFLIVFEHELCHALETALFGSTGHSSRFLSLANGLFGHTGTRHSLPTRRQEAEKNGLFVGMRVTFLYQGMRLCGQVTYIGKTATVMVADPAGAYRDSRGWRYSKYRVPLSELINSIKSQ